jgi:hypothetical protein
MERKVSLLNLIPEELRAVYSGSDVIETGWAAGPSFIARKINSYSESVPLPVACGWLEEYREIFRRCHIKLTDNAVIWLHRDEFYRYDPNDRELQKSGTFIQAGNNQVDLSEKLKLSEKLFDGKAPEIKTAYDPFLYRRRKRDVYKKSRYKRNSK